MQYAVIKSGGKQYIASEGETITVDKLESKVGEDVKFEDILLVKNGESLIIGEPIVKGAIVSGKVVKQYQGKKIDVMKFKAKVRYRRKMGFRPQLTDIKIEKIAAGVKESKAKSREK